MNSLDLIWRHLKQFNSTDDLAIAVACALEEYKPEAQWILLKYRPGTKPLSVLFSNSKRMPKAEELVPNAFSNWGSFYLDDFDNSGNAYLLVSSSQLDETAKEILANWQKLNQFGQSYHQLFTEKEKTDFEHQFSQLLHDVEGLINLFQNPEAASNAVAQRIEYQKRLNKRLLLYNRELELLPMKVSVGNLMQACLQKQNLTSEAITLEYHELSPDQIVKVDVELFDQAFAEILQNALKATKNDLNKIHIKISKRRDAFHLILKEWIIVSIIDSGHGINPDFMDWVTLPYFTTWKHDGHTGFGLAIAKKILESHQGFLEIFSTQGSGTTVNIFLPWFNENAEK